VSTQALTIFVDRDGVINEDSDAFIKTLTEWQPIPGSIEALAKLSQHFQVIVITNQSGIARGLLTQETLAAMHAQLKEKVASLGGKITDIFYCPHGPDDGCDCRKPKPGLLLQAQQRYAIDLAKSWCVGDSYRDLEAGLAVGSKVALVRTGKGLKTLAKYPKLTDTVPVFDDLRAFSASIYT
jgi:D-glycero-D-manno-heptose 1,7-bisphosphate phosphatase